MSKPHIIPWARLAGFWVCSGDSLGIGFGKTPSAAYSAYIADELRYAKNNEIARREWEAMDKRPTSQFEKAINWLFRIKEDE